MALIKCHECGREISDSAEHCPHCGCKTKQGEKTKERKGLAVNYIVVLVLGCIGLLLYFSALPDLTGHSSSFWNRGRWIYDEDTVAAVFKVTMGIGFAIGAVIDMVLIGQKAKELDEEDPEETTENVSAEEKIEIHFEPIESIPAEKRKQGNCQMCGKTGNTAICKIPKFSYDYTLCVNCINKYKASIK